MYRFIADCAHFLAPKKCQLLKKLGVTRCSKCNLAATQVGNPTTSNLGQYATAYQVEIV